ncbi:MAG: META domain-containing protein [Chloracidobacterium sp.]|nr:META domain-containing protein [Chloracidobacterium sp.]
MKKTLVILFISVVFGLSIQAQSIAGNWNLTWLLIEHDMAYSIMAPITLTMDENGKISGNGGCNTFGGTYTFKKPSKPFKKPLKIKFGVINATEMACEKTSRAEVVFFRSLREASTIFIKDGELFIANLKQGHSMTFVRITKSP